jgi:hypothetical protein
VVEGASAEASWEAGQGTVPLEWVNQLIAEGFDREAVLNVLYIGVDICTARIMLTCDGLDWNEEPDSTSSGYSSGDPKLDRKGPIKLCSCPGIMPAGRGTKSTHGCAVELDNPTELETGVCHDCATGDCSKGTGCQCYECCGSSYPGMPELQDTNCTMSVDDLTTPTANRQQPSDPFAMCIEPCSDQLGMYRQRLRQSPEAKRMHVVDQEAIMAVLQGLSDEEALDGADSEDNEGSKSVTETDSEDQMGSDAAALETMEVDRGSGTDTWNDADTDFESTDTTVSEDIASSDEDGGFDCTQQHVISTRAGVKTLSTAGPRRTKTWQEHCCAS